MIEFHDEETVTHRVNVHAAFHSLRWIGLTSFMFILLQSACTAVMAISGVRLLIGLSALAATSGLNRPATGFHADALRIPTLAVAVLGSAINLYFIWRIRSLRARSATSSASASFFISEERRQEPFTEKSCCPSLPRTSLHSGSTPTISAAPFANASSQLSCRSSLHGGASR